MLVSLVVLVRFICIRCDMLGLCMVMLYSWVVVFMVVLLWLMKMNCIFLFILCIIVEKWFMLVLFSGVLILLSR